MKKVEIFEDQRAARYNSFVEAWIPNYHYFMEKLPKLLKDSTQKNLLVVGAGTGTEIEYIVQHSPQWTITGVDPSPDMIRQAKDKLGAFPQVQLVEGVVDQLPPDQTFSAATLILVLHFMKDDGTKFQLLQSIASRLGQHAPFVLLDITGGGHTFKANLQLLRHFVPDHLTTEEVDERLQRIENKIQAIPEDRLIKLITEAGFEPPIRFFQNTIYTGWITRKR